MTAVYRLYNSSTVVDLFSGQGRLRPGGNLGMPEAKRVFATPWNRGFSPLVATSYGNRTVSWVVIIKGTSADDWTTTFRQVQDIFNLAQDYEQSGGTDGDRAYLSLQMDGATAAVEFDVLTGEINATEAVTNFLMKSTSIPTLPEAALSIVLKPWAHPQALTSVTSGTLDAGSSTYTLAAPSGDRSSPMRITFQSAAGDTPGRVIIARDTQGIVANAPFVFECETGAFTGYTVTDIEASANFSLSNVADGAASGGSKLRITHAASGADTLADVVKWTINLNLADMRGRWRVFIKNTASHAQLSAFRLLYGGSDGKAITLASVAGNGGTTDAFLELGIVTIPERRAPLGTAITSFLFVLQATMTSAVYTNDLDCLFFVPLSEEYVDVRSLPAVAQDMTVFDNLIPEPQIYALDSTGVFKANTRTVAFDSGFTTKPGLSHRWYCLPVRGAALANTVDLTDDFTLKFEYYEQYDLFK